MTRFADIQILRYELKDFNSLTINQKEYIYYLSEAALWGRDITFDQFGIHNLEIRRELEKLPMTDYLKRVWFSKGMHHHYSLDKFYPEFTREWFIEQGGSEHIADIIFSETIEPHRVWNPDGDYSAIINKIVYWLTKAKEVAENEQQQRVIEKLITYYKSDAKSHKHDNNELFDDYSIEWVKATEGQIDFVNGFIEVYADPAGKHPSWESIVEYKDLEATKRTQKICQNAQWFEDNSPVDPRFKKPVVKGVTANVINAAMLGGDEYPASAIGINLPNADWIRAEHGSKSVTIGNLISAYNSAAKGNGMREEFVIDDTTRELLKNYADTCDELHTDLHECLGHGSGQLLPGVSPEALNTYHSTIEEARADLFGLYYIADPKLVELGLLPDVNAYKSQYYSYLLNGLLTQMVRIKPGAQYAEAHMHTRALIARWVQERGGCELIKLNNKTFVRVSDYEKLRGLFAELLAEIQRVKSEGDLKAAQALVEQYGTKLGPTLHEEVLARYEKLNEAPYKGFINPKLTPGFDSENNIIDINVYNSESYEEQMLRYSRDYSIN